MRSLPLTNLNGVSRLSAVVAMYAAFTLPVDLTSWTPTRVNSGSEPKFIVQDQTWTITTESSVGGVAVLLPKSQIASSADRSQLRWSWSVKTFPNTHPEIPFKKENDDYAIRVGALISDLKTSIRVPAAFQKRLDANEIKLSYVVFYCASKEVPGGEKCGVSPYNDRIINCLVPAKSEFQAITQEPVKDLIRILGKDNITLQVVGAWIFSDSDNSKSSSTAQVKGLEVL